MAYAEQRAELDRWQQRHTERALRWKELRDSAILDDMIAAAELEEHEREKAGALHASVETSRACTAEMQPSAASFSRLNGNQEVIPPAFCAY